MHIRHLIAWLVLVAAVTAQSVRHIRGVVVDENDRPVAGVAVCPFLTSMPFLTADLAADPATKTKADGTFELQWDPWQGPVHDAVLFVAEGRVTVAAGLIYVDMTPVIMPPARTLAGTVRDGDGDGEPVAGVRVEARDWLVQSDLFGLGGGKWSMHPEPRTAVRSDASGRFILKGTCDSAISLRVGGDGFTTSNYGPLAAGQSFDAAVERSPVVTVTVLDVGGKAMSGVMIGAVGKASGSQIGGYTDAKGEWRFTWFGKGTITVSASTQRYVPLGAVKLTEPKERVRLLAEASRPPLPEPAPAEGTVAVRGRVVDSDGVKPMRAAYVCAVKPVEAENVSSFVLDGGARRPGAVRTAADGSFVMYLPPGAYCLVAAGENLGVDFVMHGRERNPTPRRIQVVAGKDHGEVELRMQTVVRIQGKVDTSSVPRGSMVRFVPHRPGVLTSGEDFDFSLRFPVAADGSFAAEGLLARAYQVQLLVPRGFRQGLPDKVPLKVVEAADGGHIEVAVKKVPRGVVSGQVRSQVPASRLAVMSLPVSSKSELMYSCVNYRGPVCPVQRDGSYELVEPLGERALLVIDLWSGVVLHRAEQIEVVPGKRQQSLEVTAVPLDVTWGDVSAHASPWLYIVVAENNWPTGLGQMAAVQLARNDCGLGVPLPHDAKSIRLWLQPGDTRLVLRKQHGVRSDNTGVLANVIVDPSEQPEVRLGVRD